MKLRYSMNEPMDIGYVPKGNEDITLIKTIELPFIANRDQVSFIDKNNFLLKINGNDYSIATSMNMLKGEYRVAEKWIYPYWKSESRFYYPSDNNPLGKYLIILTSEKTGKKVLEGIHQWINWECETNVFSRGEVDNPGCIRTDSKDIEEIFDSLSLESLVVVK